MKTTNRFAVLAGAVLATLATVANADYYGHRAYEVTITNITKGQVFSPPVLVTHNQRVALFEVGASRYVFCVNVDAVIAALLLALLWQDFKSGSLSERDLETAGRLMHGHLRSVESRLIDQRLAAE